jgi:hypothetical protein
MRYNIYHFTFDKKKTFVKFIILSFKDILMLSIAPLPPPKKKMRPLMVAPPARPGPARPGPALSLSACPSPLDAALRGPSPSDLWGGGGAERVYNNITDHIF